MAISVDYATLVITVPQADLTFVTGTLYEHDTNAFRLELKDWEDDSDGMAMERTHRHNTEVTVAGTTFARTFEIINGYSVAYEDTGSQYSVRLAGSNNNIFDVESGILVQNGVQVIAQNSAGLVNPGGLSSSTQLQIDQVHGQVVRCVFLDTEKVATGNGYQQTPWNNFPDAVDDMETYNLKELVIQSDATVDRKLKNLVIHGQGLPAIDLNGEEIDNTIVNLCELTGSHIGTMQAIECLISNLTNMGGIFRTCAISGTIGAQAGNSLLLWDITPAVAGLPFTIDLSPVGSCTVGIQNCTGGAIVTGMNSSDDVFHFHGLQGSLTIDATCTAGTIVITGDVGVTDNSGGATVLTNLVSSSLTWDKALNQVAATGSVEEFVTKKLLRFTQFVGLK